MNDLKGRQVMTMHEVRGALVTAQASLTTGTSTDLIAGDSAEFLDIIEVTFANNSTVAATVDLKNDGSVVRTFVVPVGTTYQVKFDSPLPQPVKNTPWVVDMEDITGTTLSIGAVLIKNI